MGLEVHTRPVNDGLERNCSAQHKQSEEKRENYDDIKPNYDA